jgi:hypothetical protein
MALSGRLSYAHEIKTRLQFLNFVLTYFDEGISIFFFFSSFFCLSLLPNSLQNKLVLEYSNYDSLWVLLVDNSITPVECDEFFSWLIGARREPPDGYAAIDDDNASNLFTNRMLTLRPSAHSSLSFRCFQRYFCDRNIKKGSMKWKDHIKEDDFEVLDMNLVGYNELWDIALDVQHPDVVNEAMEFLIKLQNKISPKLLQQMSKEQAIRQRREEFIQRTIVALSQPLFLHVLTPYFSLSLLFFFFVCVHIKRYSWKALPIPTSCRKRLERTANGEFCGA